MTVGRHVQKPFRGAIRRSEIFQRVPFEPGVIQKQILESSLQPMKQNSLGVIIARRTLCWPGKDGRKITVLIGKPRLFPKSKRSSHRDYYCPYQIVGVGDQKTRYSASVDAVQALQLVFTAIGIDIQLLNKRRSPPLKWLVQGQVMECDENFKKGGEYFKNCGFPETPQGIRATTLDWLLKNK